MVLLLSKEQKLIEEAAVKNGVTLESLMERAGRALYQNIEDKLRKRLRGISCAVLCGGGGNGGDGFVAARCLKESGASVSVIMCSESPKAGDSGAMFEKALSANVPVIVLTSDEQLSAETVEKAQVIVDAVYGIGFHGALSEPVSKIFASANANKTAYKISADVPSGVGADSGCVCENAFSADTTLAMVGFKPAHILKCSADQCGNSLLAEIGIPDSAYESVKLSIGELTERIASRILPKRSECAHKGICGRLLEIVGSDRYRGAAVLCTKGALVCGAGLISVASGENTLKAVASHCPEAVLIDIVIDSKYFADTLSRADACAIGCGLSLTNSARGLVENALETAKCPLICDADGINILAENINLLKGHKQTIVLTPHLGELARLCGKSMEEIKADRIGIAREFAAEYDVTIVLKSENTMIVFPSGEVFVCTIGNAGLAKGGSGDLLCGVIASFAAMDIAPTLAAMLGVYVHSRAADLAAMNMPMHCMTASVVAEFIPSAIAELECE
ncbi:MAG: NAD(P)H-hydrate dehydratase [Oscillospiraceae bacterium]